MSLSRRGLLAGIAGCEDSAHLIAAPVLSDSDGVGQSDAPSEAIH